MEAVRLEQAASRRRRSGPQRLLRGLGRLGIVVALVAFVAALFVPTFDDGMGGHPVDSSAKTDARNMVSMVEACFTDTRDYRGCVDTTGIGTNTGLTFGTGPGKVNVVAHTRRSYTITAQSKSGNTFAITKVDREHVSRWCEVKGEGGCPASGEW